jgi:hypothetical protein
MAMTPELAPCQCTAPQCFIAEGEPCGRTATQEDLLCDDCRVIDPDTVHCHRCGD